MLGGVEGVLERATHMPSHVANFCGAVASSFRKTQLPTYNTCKRTHDVLSTGHQKALPPNISLSFASCGRKKSSSVFKFSLVNVPLFNSFAIVV